MICSPFSIPEFLLFQVFTQRGAYLVAACYIRRQFLTYEDLWGTHDLVGHGTNIAGLVAFEDLQKVQAWNAVTVGAFTMIKVKAPIEISIP